MFATSYRASMFTEAFGDGSRLGLDLVYITEDEPLGTAGAIRNAAQELTCDNDSPVLVLNGDILSGHDLGAQIAMHEKSGAAVTLHLTLVSDARRYGSVPTTDAGRVLDFVEKSPNPPTNQVNAGCYVFRRSVIGRIPTGRPVSVEYETFPAMLAEGSTITGYVEGAYWLDVGTPAAFVKGACDLVSGQVLSPAVKPAGDAFVMERAVVAADAVLSGGTTVGMGAVVEPGATVTSSVLFDEAVIERGARVCRSVVGRGTRIGVGAVLEDAVVGDGAIVGSGNELCGGTRVWPGIELPPTAVRFSSDL